MVSAVRYRYLPLPTGSGNSATSGKTFSPGNGNDQTSIRLLTVQPASFEKDVEADLSIVWLDPTKPVEYEALSYVWGAPQNPENIYIGTGKNAYLDIGKNLITALRYLRLTSRPRTLWIDAICINQADIAERGAQVANMGNIYRLASKVIAWLGSEESDSGRAMDLLDNLGAKLEIDPITRAMKPSAAGSSEPFLADRKHVIDLSGQDVVALKHLFQRAWFDRLWIRQEIYLGHASAVVQTGLKTVSWRNFSVAALRILRNEKDQAGSEVREALARRLSWLQELFYHDLVMLEQIRRLCGRCLCSDQRDRVYAVMNMLPEHQKQFIGHPDYTLPALEVWKRAVLSYIRHYKKEGPECLSLLILDECAGEEPFEKPTWLPNWEVKDPTDPTRTFTFLGMSGSLMTPSVEYIEHGDILRVLGVRIQRIQGLVPIPSRAKLLSGVQDFMREIDIHKSYPGGRTYLDACGYTFLGGQVQEQTSPPRDDKPTEAEIRQGVNAIISAEGDFAAQPNLTSLKFQAISSDCLVGRNLLKTDDGYIGVAPRNAQVGDQIVALAGGYSPVILRPSKQDSSKYHLIGSCYVEGFMWLEGFLGPLPANHRYVAHHTPGENYVSFKVLNSETQGFTAGDPRLMSWPIVEEYLHACDKDDLYTVDPLADSSKKMGVDAEFFDII
jgi:hypothetical protein